MGDPKYFTRCILGVVICCAVMVVTGFVCCTKIANENRAQQERTERVDSRQEEKTERTDARQDGRTDRAGERQDGKTDRTEARSDRVL